MSGAQTQAPVVLGCDTIVALPGAAAGGVALFGKNSDRPPGEPQAPVLLERATHAPGTTVRCQYVEIPQVRATARVLGSRPTWLWGFEMGLNEHGVAIGNETIFAHEAPAAVGLLGMDLVRLGLERAASAPHALEILIELIETHGQGGSGYRDMDWPYNNSFLVADPREAFVLEAVGRQWASRRCDAVDSISNHVSIGTDWDRLGGATAERARAAGLAVAEPFDFALAYRDTSVVPPVLSSGRLRRSRRLLHDARGRHTLATLRSVLRDHHASGPRFARGAAPDQEAFYTLCMHEGPSRTAMSMVAELEPRPRGAHAAWLAFGRPCASAYVPLLVAGELPEILTGAGREDAAGGAGLWWVLERIAAAVEASPDCAAPVEETFAALERDVAARFASLRGEIAGLAPDELGARATRWASEVGGELDRTARALAAAVRA
jgi:dipeptidase